MEDLGIKVVVDYANGCYNVTGILENRLYTFGKPIRGIDRDGFYKASFSRRQINSRKIQMKKVIKNIAKADPNFRYSKKALNKVDPLLYKTLEDWDDMKGTSYASHYLKTMVQKFDINAYPPGIPRDMFEEECKKARAEELANLGIDITYNVALFNVHSSINLLDRMKGIRYARDQKKMLGVKVLNSFILRKRLLSSSVSEFSDEYLRRKREMAEEKLLQDDQFSERIVMEAEKNIKSYEAHKDLESKLQASLENLDNEPESELSSELEQKEEKSKKAPYKRTVRRPHAPKSNSKKAQHYRNSDKKKRVRNHTGVRTEPTRRQRLNAAKKQQREYNSHYNTQMRLKSEKEAKKKQASEAMAKKQAEEEAKRLEEERIAEEAKRLEEERIAEETRKQEEQRLAAEARRRAKEAAAIAAIRRAQAEIRRNEEAQTRRKVEKIDTGRLNRRIMAEARHWTRKLRNVKESIKNMKFVHKDENKSKIIKKFNFDKIKRRVQAEVRHWTRKIRNAKESVKNMKFKPHINREKAKKVVITGFVSVLLVATVATGVKTFNNINDRIHGNSPEVTTSTEYHGNDDSRETPTVEEKESKTATESESGSETSTGEVTLETSSTEMGEVHADNSGKEVDVDTLEKDTEAETETEVEAETETEVEAETETEVEQENEVESVSESEAEVEEEIPAEEEALETKSDEEKMEELQNLALQKYQEAIIIGEQPAIKDIFQDQVFHTNPSGKDQPGSKDTPGLFSDHPNFNIEFINIITNDGWKTVSANGRSLSELLAEYPDYITYNFHVVDSKTGVQLGFVTQEQYEKMIKDQVNKIVESKTNSNTKTADIDLEDYIH